MSRDSHKNQMDMNENPDAFWKVRELAVSARVTVAALLREANVGPSTIHQWKHGQARPRAKTIQRLNQAATRLRERNLK